mgnify:CR=1 FL=1
MTAYPPDMSYSFSMINLVKLLPDWSWPGFDQVMAQTGTNRVELVPSMVLGVDWDLQIGAQSGPVQNALERLLKQYEVASIQSLTYGLQINLADPLTNHPELLTRLQALAVLGKTIGCSVFILGSPGQKKLLNRSMSHEEHKQRFIDNCRWMANTLGPKLVLSLEHNTITQGAEYCNTLEDIIDVVTTLKRYGVANVGLNLDTKCLIQEYGGDMQIANILRMHGLLEVITSIQVSYDFLARDVPHSASDQRQLRAFALARNLPISLEEFGLLGNQVVSFVDIWRSNQ